MTTPRVQTYEQQIEALRTRVHSESRYYHLPAERILEMAEDSLSGAKELIQKEGWTARPSGYGRGGHCIINAIYQMGRLTYVKVIATEVMTIATRSGRHVSGWNDESGRTQEEVLELFDKGIELLQQMKKNEA